MEKLKQNKIWLTIIVIGVVIIGILLAMLHQQKQSSPEAQSSSYASSTKAASSSQKIEDQNNEKAYAKKASTMKEHVIVMGSGAGDVFFTKMNLNEFTNMMNSWADNYSKMTEKQKYSASISMGTPEEHSNSQFDTKPLDSIYNSFKSGDYEAVGYYETVKAFNKSYSAFNPDDIKQ